PPTSTGATRETSASNGGSFGTTTPTTPVGSGSVKLKYGPETGFDEPSTCASLSAQPAYQTIRSIDRSTSSRPEQSSANSAARAAGRALSDAPCYSHCDVLRRLPATRQEREDPRHSKSK